MKAIYFDMDGTLASLYDYPNWLEMLRAEDTTPYEECGVLVDIEEMREVLNDFISSGITLGIISWGAMGGSREYCRRTRKAKIEWCEKYFPNVFTEYHVVKYGTPKHQVRNIKDSILVDDNAEVREAWKGETVDASDTKEMISLLKELLLTLQLDRMNQPNWQNSFIKEYHHAMSPIFLDKVTNTELNGGLYLIGQTTFNPHTNQKYYWVKVGTTNRAKSRFSSYRTDTPTLYFTDWVSHQEKQHPEEWYHLFLAGLCLKQHRSEWFQVEKETYLKICEEGFNYFD